MEKKVLDRLADEYSLFRDVRDGNTTLEETLRLYEQEFYQISEDATRLMKIKGRDKLKEDITIYNQKMNDLLSIVTEIETYSAQNNIDLDEYIKNKRVLKKDNILNITAVIFYLGLITVPLAAIIDIKRIDYNFDKKMPAESKIKDTESAFKQLKSKASRIDELVHRTYITKYAKDNPELFRKIYLKMGREDREAVKLKVENLIDFGIFGMSWMEWEEFIKKVEE